MRVILAFCFMLLFSGPAVALEVAGVQIEPAVTVNNHVLKLNGSGIRKKLFVKIYIGSLYASKRLSSATEALRDNGDKLIRMNFLHSKVDKEKIVGAFSEGIANNSPDLARSAEVKKFQALFSADFNRGDIVDLVLDGNGSVTVKHNSKLLGTVVSTRLATGILAIYLGDKPADDALKSGMLGH